MNRDSRASTGTDAGTPLCEASPGVNVRGLLKDAAVDGRLEAPREGGREDAAAPRAAGGAVQGGGRDLRGRALRALPGRHPLRLVRCSRSPEHTPSHQPPQALRPSGPLRPEHGPLHPLHPSAQGPAPVLVPTPAPRADRNKSADSRRVCMQIRTTLCSVLQLPMDASLEYKKHTDSMRDNSSYRNANSNFG